MAVRITGFLADLGPLHKVPLSRAMRRVQKGPLQGVSPHTTKEIRVVGVLEVVVEGASGFSI